MYEECLKEQARKYVDEYMRDWCGEPQDAYILREQLEKGEGILYEEFKEFLSEKYEIHL
jgi:hypothetical protein